EDGDPGIEDIRKNFEIIVEATKYECRFSQVHRGARRSTLGNQSFSVVDLIAIGQTGDFLIVILPLGLRDQYLVADQIVHVAGTHRARITKIVDLNGSRPMRKNGRARSSRKTVHVDQQIDLFFFDPQRNVPVAQGGAIDKRINRSLDEPARFGPVVGAYRYR